MDNSYTVSVFEDSYLFYSSKDDNQSFKTADQAIEYGKQKMISQRDYRSNTGDMWIEVRFNNERWSSHTESELLKRK